jgi:hypothetical protein
MRTRLLISSAIAALLAGTVSAGAQTEHQGPAAGAAQEKSTPQGKGASQAQEKKQPVQRNSQREEKGAKGGQIQTQGQGEREQNLKGERDNGQRQMRERNPRGEPDRTSGQGQREETTQKHDQNAQPSRNESQQNHSGGSASFTTEQRTKIRETVLRGSTAPRVSHVDFNIRVGTAVPKSVHVVAVPEVLVDVHPEWRGFMYFVYNDEIIIVEPGSLKIVAVVEV